LIEDIGITELPQAITVQYRVVSNPGLEYPNYYIGEKLSILQYAGREFFSLAI
jgi:hypothetical protein